MNPNINSLSDMNDRNENSSGRPAISAYVDALKETIAEMPLFAKALPIVILILYILACFFWHISFYLSNMLQYTIFKFQLWRIVTATIVMTSLINIVFAFIFWIPEAMKLERALGSIRYALLFTINGILIQVFYSLLLIPLIFLFGNKLLTLGLNTVSSRVECNGIWPIVMMDITVLCLSNPNHLIRFFCIPWSLKAKYYPFILLAFFTLLNGLQFDIFVGTVYGITYIYLLQDKLNFSDSFVAKCEESFAFKWMKNFKGFVPNASAIGLSSQSLDYQNPSSNSDAQQSNQRESDFINANQQQQNKGFNAFKGKGVPVGGGNV